MDETSTQTSQAGSAQVMAEVPDVQSYEVQGDVYVGGSAGPSKTEVSGPSAASAIMQTEGGTHSKLEGLAKFPIDDFQEPKATLDEVAISEFQSNISESQDSSGPESLELLKKILEQLLMEKEKIKQADERDPAMEVIILLLAVVNSLIHSAKDAISNREE
ncbi:MAG: hypothetical protein HYT09_03825 [Candidatus Levybacteria bacterium]|nr:hypothetical protein [Candidatus Levybacteria bacterium]